VTRISELVLLFVVVSGAVYSTERSPARLKASRTLDFPTTGILFSEIRANTLPRQAE
jgi:hypothetical protein